MIKILSENKDLKGFMQPCESLIMFDSSVATLCKTIVIACSLSLIGCVSQQHYDISNYDTLRNNCVGAHAQIIYLKGRIDQFHEHFHANPGHLTLPHRRYYTRLKNNLWSLRSSCVALQQ